MMRDFEVEVDILPLRLSKSSVHALRRIGAYDQVVFTSKNAVRLFRQEMRIRGIKVPQKRLVRVGSNAELLKLPLTGKRILFPRSVLASDHILRALRDKNVIVRTVPLYTARGRRLSSHQRGVLLSGIIDRLYFKSPSGITGLLEQLERSDRDSIRKIAALCIGSTTAAAARKAGWKKVSIKG